MPFFNILAENGSPMPGQRRFGVRGMVQDARARMDNGASISDAWTGSGLYGRVPAQIMPHMQSEENMRWAMENPDILEKWNIAEGLKVQADGDTEPLAEDGMRAFLKRPKRLADLYAAQQNAGGGW